MTKNLSVRRLLLKSSTKAVSPSTKPSDASAKLPEEVEAEGEVVTEEEETGLELDLEDDLNALVSGEELTEEFKEKAKTIFGSSDYFKGQC